MKVQVLCKKDGRIDDHLAPKDQSLGKDPHQSAMFSGGAVEHGCDMQRFWGVGYMA
jgi:hypothetical protein